MKMKTPKERTKAMLAEPWNPDPDPYSKGKRSFLSHEELERRIEQLVIEAVKDCAKIADSRRQSEIELASESRRHSKQLSEVGHTFSANAAEEIARQIRARSEGPIEPPK